ncbi:MAG TPA: cupin domain-containing protein, partial [Syntrophorhabdus sp.]|nr:cupin domain-containing protein [Syntrophorhabdus sp.]
MLDVAREAYKGAVEEEACIFVKTNMRGIIMIVRNFNDPEVLQTTYRAHYGATARMVLTSRFLQSMEFLAYAMLPAGNVIEEHVDEVEEIYLIAQGGGLMKVGNEEKEVKEWDAIWIPAGEPHRLE